MGGWVCEVDLRRDSADGLGDDRTVLSAYRSTELGALLCALGLVLAGHREQIAAEFDQVLKLARALGLDKLTDTATGDGDQHADDDTLVVRAPDGSEQYRVSSGGLVPRGGLRFPSPAEIELARATDAELRQAMKRLMQAVCSRLPQDPPLAANVVDQVLALLKRGDEAQVGLDQVVEAHDRLNGQIGQLATYIMDEIPGEPSQSESAVECAIRLLKQWRQDSVTLNSLAHSVAVVLGETDEGTSVVANPAELVNRLIDDYRCLTEQQATDIAEARAEPEEP